MVTNLLMNKNELADRNLLALYKGAMFHGWLHRLWARLTRRCFNLEDLAEALKDSSICSSYYGGLKTVDIDRIRGTEGKADAFDAEFNPIQEKTRTRWLDIAAEKLRGRELPPVELVQVGDTYYVRDGHHRISVSRSMGQQFVDAQVIILLVNQNRIIR